MRKPDNIRKPIINYLKTITIMKTFNQKPLNEKMAIITGVLFLAFIVWALSVGDITGFNNTYLK